jgi:diaminopropionate ammonia-lyase
LARRLGVGTVLVKDESERMNLPSFKILGASWAVLDAIATNWLASPHSLTLEDTIAALPQREGRGLVAATDGNHGRGVARMAKLLGLGCRILVPAGTATSRIEAIAAEGADVEVVDGTYDDAIAASASLADDNHLVVSDTSWPGYERTPRAVVSGYSTMFYEIDAAVAEGRLPHPDVIAFQAGVGAFAAAGLRHYRAPAGEVSGPTSAGRGDHDEDTGSMTSPGAARARTVAVEPSSANCLMVSSRENALTPVPGPHSSTMAGLNCGLPSQLVWPILQAGIDVFVAIDDDSTEEAMRALADEGIVAGESGAAGLAGLLALRAHASAEQLEAAGLNRDASVLVVNTEGATDPDNYARVVGRSAEQVAAMQEPGQGSSSSGKGRTSAPTVTS